MGKMKMVAEGETLILADGNKVKSLEELFAAVQEMDHETLSKHVNAKKHDFHSWVQTAHGNESLALQLLSANDSKAIARILGQRVNRRHLPIKSPVKAMAAQRKASGHHYISIGAAVLLVVGFLGLATYTANPTAAVVAGSAGPEASLLGLGGVGAVVTMLFTALHVIKRKNVGV